VKPRSCASPDGLVTWASSSRPGQAGGRDIPLGQPVRLAAAQPPSRLWPDAAPYCWRITTRSAARPPPQPRSRLLLPAWRTLPCRCARGSRQLTQRIYILFCLPPGRRRLILAPWPLVCGHILPGRLQVVQVEFGNAPSPCPYGCPEREVIVANGGVDVRRY
jgi:hypothetical protein